MFIKGLLAGILITLIIDKRFFAIITATMYLISYCFWHYGFIALRTPLSMIGYKLPYPKKHTDLALEKGIKVLDKIPTQNTANKSNTKANHNKTITQKTK